MNKYTYRDYIVQDNEKLISLMNDFQDYLLSIDPLNRLRRMSGYGESQLAKTLKDILKENGKFIVVLHNNKIIGFAVGIIIHQTDEEKLEVIPSVTGRITELYVDTTFRHRGIGTVLIRMMEQYFKDNNCDTVRIEVFEPNTPANMLYEKVGYKSRIRDLIKKV